MAGYFSYFPNVYVGEGVSDDENFKYRLVKNIFRRVKARPDLSEYSTLFEAYSIGPGETPPVLAEKLFDDPFVDWAILLINDIIDVYEQWPKSRDQLERYVSEKYTADKVDATHHWETNEILYNDIVFIKEGIEVNENWRTVLPDGTTKTKDESIYEVTNWEHEYFKNEEKRQILIPIGNMLQIMIEEFEELVAYEPHIELDKSNNKQTKLNIASRFLNNTGSVSFASLIESQFNSSAADITFNDGPSASAGVSSDPAPTTTTTTTSTAAATTTSTTTPTPTPSPSPTPTPSPSPSGGGYGGY